MEKTFRLARTTQCSKCPWKKSTDPNKIPNGYSVEKHKNLSCTIANGPDNLFNGKLSAMACHETSGGNEQYCIGWLMNQLGPGNNLLLRLKMRNCENAGELKVYGKQHETFEDTIPK